MGETEKLLLHGSQAIYYILIIVLVILINRKMKQLDEVAALKVQLKKRLEALNATESIQLSKFNQLKSLKAKDDIELYDKTGWITDAIIVENDTDNKSLTFNIDGNEYERGYHEIEMIILRK